jgi:hypothetical protein
MTNPNGIAINHALNYSENDLVLGEVILWDIGYCVELDGVKVKY